MMNSVRFQLRAITNSKHQCILMAYKKLFYRKFPNQKPLHIENFQFYNYSPKNMHQLYHLLVNSCLYWGTAYIGLIKLHLSSSDTRLLFRECCYIVCVK